MDYTSFLTTVSSCLTAFQTPEFLNLKEDLHSFTQAVTSLEHEVVAAISAIPIHPYERLKYQYFGPDYNFKTIEDVEDPETIPAENCIDYIKQKNKEIMRTTFHNLTCCEEDKVYTAFSICSGDKVVPDINKQKNYIEFLEIAKSIPIQEVNEENCMVYARKLIGSYMKSI